MFFVDFFISLFPFSLLNEVRLLQSVSHPNIIRLEEVIDCPKMLVLVLELAEGGELFEQMLRKTVLDEATAKFYFQQMSSATAYLHGRKICHRDLKPQNVLLCSAEDQNPVLKLADLNISGGEGDVFKEPCGTFRYMAPEIYKLSRQLSPIVYSFKVDCWALVSHKRPAL